MIKKILLVVLLGLVVAIAWNWELVYYGIRMGEGQFKIIWNARPVEEFMKDPAFPDSLKTKLRLIDEVRKYAIDSLGLKDTKNYKTLYDQKDKEVMWVVQACAPFALQPKHWHFPIVGEVPYKGYFNKEKAVNEGKELKKEGWDISIRNPGGWSTLGWFTDPILSDMLKRSDGDLASLIIHEMVHATVFVKNNVDFNENLADFIADTAAYDFLRHKYGGNSKQYLTYLHDDQDYSKYSRHILRGTHQLDSLYKSMKKSDPVAEKKRKKETMIRKIFTSMDTLSLYEKRNTEGYLKHLPNNTYFMSYRLYQAKQDTFSKEFNEKFKGNIKAYVAYLTKKHSVL